ncbi:MAG TPA: carboxypeptidase-like regulatory domain-containing protein [Solirubrobacterales bacterium]|nr:carboxypeptidase-like regulatory domain-containing protein [Solirubrobacterales bacterium]
MQFDTIVKAGRTPVPLSAGFRRTTQRDGKEVNEFLTRASLILPRMAFTGFVVHRDTEGGTGFEDGTEVGLLANTRFLGISARGEASYRLNGPQRGFDSASVTLEKALDDRSDLRLDIEHTARTGLTEFELGYVRQFRQLALRGSGRLDTAGGIGASLALAFSFGPDPLGGGWRMSSEKLAQRGQTAVAVYLDEDGDGRRSPGEEALPGVGITAGPNGTSQPTDADGHAFVEGLQPYDKVLVSLDESTLPDPFLVLRGKGFVVTPRPGVPAVIELAVSPTGEVEGVLNSPEGTPLSGAELELLGENGEVVANTLSEYDGFFLFERVAYGRYRLRLAADSERALGLTAGELAGAIEIGPEQTVERLGTLRLRAPASVARARDPPAGGSP